MRSAFSIAIRVALGTSTPTSITVVATRSWILPSLKASIASSFLAEGMRPCTSPTRIPGSASAALAEALPGIRVGLVHGRMPSAKKDEAMLAFKEGKIQLLVATTVIEVGVDVPNATLMAIENAERMGLAQLHQLRGRVGRGTSASTCVLLYRGPLSQLARERLKAIRETNDGFEIARRDLELRGP